MRLKFLWLFLAVPVAVPLFVCAGCFDDPAVRAVRRVGGSCFTGNDLLDYSAYTTGVNVSLATGTATGVNGGASGGVRGSAQVKS